MTGLLLQILIDINDTPLLIVTMVPLQPLQKLFLSFYLPFFLNVFIYDSGSQSFSPQWIISSATALLIIVTAALVSLCNCMIILIKCRLSSVLVLVLSATAFFTTANSYSCISGIAQGGLCNGTNRNVVNTDLCRTFMIHDNI